MDEPIENGIGKCRIVQPGMPMFDRQLTGDDGRAYACAIIDDFQKIVASSLLKRSLPPVIQNQHVNFCQLCQLTSEAPVAVGDSQIVQQSRYSDIQGREALTAGLIGQCAGQPGFTDTGGTGKQAKQIPYIIAARLTQPLQRQIYQATGWWALEAGLELTEFCYQAAGWTTSRRLIVVRQSVKRWEAPCKTLSLFADDADFRAGAMVPS